MIELRQNFTLSQATFINFICLSEAEKEIVHQWRNHPDIRKWMRNNQIIEFSEHLDFIRRLENDNKNFYWLAKNKDLRMGVTYLNNVELSNKSAYLGIYSNPQLQGTGHIMMESIKELSFGLCGLNKLKVEVMEINQKAINFYEKSGFTQRDLDCKKIIRNGKRYNVLFMDITNNQTTRIL